MGIVRDIIMDITMDITMDNFIDMIMEITIIIITVKNNIIIIIEYLIAMVRLGQILPLAHFIRYKFITTIIFNSMYLKNK